MFVGHYGVSFAAKAADRSIPLWLLFVAVQFVDVLWGGLVLLGIERVRIVPGITASNPFDLYYMPYTHSLVASVLWAGGAVIAYRFVQGWRGSALVVGAAVLSHWILDFVVHRPDLPLYDNTMKVGLGTMELSGRRADTGSRTAVRGPYLVFVAFNGAQAAGQLRVLDIRCRDGAHSGVDFFRPSTLVA